MPLDTLPQRLITPTRDQSRALYLRSLKIRVPSVDDREGSEPWIRALVIADIVVPIHANAQYVAQNVDKTNMRGDLLDVEGASLGESRLPAQGASGYVIVGDETSALGGTIFADDEIKPENGNGKRYKCLVTAVYLAGDYVPVVGVDVGPSTDQDPGTVMTWTTPRPGIDPSAVVATNADGTGLSGGSDNESDEDYAARLQQLRANPPASGNDAQYQTLIAKTPGLAVEQAFTIPSILGPGTIAILFTVRPSTAGASRLPNSTQRALVASWIEGQMPAGDVKFVCSLTSNNVDVYLTATWAPQARGWIDRIPWPQWDAASQVTVKATPAPTATTFRITGTTATTGDPAAGQTIAFFDRANLLFRRKKILTATAAGADFDIVCDTTLGASDTSYVPVASQPCCPWSDSLDSLTAAIVTYFDALGPGEQVAAFFDPGLRQRRSPASPTYWSSVVSNRLLDPLFQLPVVQDVAMKLPAVPHVTPTGTPGVDAYLHVLRYLVAFPQ